MNGAGDGPIAAAPSTPASPAVPPPPSPDGLEPPVAAGLKFSGTVVHGDGDGWNEDVARLATRHSPVFVLFPDAVKDSSKPYPDGQHDYHPRPVETYLDRAFLVSQAQATWARLAITTLVSLGIAVIFLVLASLVVALFIRLDVVVYFLVVVPGLAIFAVGLLLVVLQFTPPHGTDELRESLARRDPPWSWAAFRTNRRPSLRSAESAWTSYCGRAEQWNGTAEPAGQRAVYLHIVHGDDVSSLALQYWLFYEYNDWKNTHESDWECVTLFFGPDWSNDSSEPIAAAYSTHLGNRWRRWPDIKKVRVDGQMRPLAYVARGSHANYFEPRLDGYVTSVDVPNQFINALPIPGMNRLIGGLSLQVGGRAPTGSSKDYVAQIRPGDYREFPEQHDYRIEVMPLKREYVDPSGEPTIWQRWWWMSYDGKWGVQGRLALTGIDGPMFQRIRWYQPYEWTSSSGQADASWEEAFEPAALPASE